MTHPTGITAVGHYVPPTIRANADFEALGTSDEWIRARTGIRERRIAVECRTSDMAVHAARECLAQRGMSASDLDCIILASMTPDYPVPSTASVVGRKLGANRAWGFDLSAACSGFVFGLVTASSLVAAGRARRVLLCGAERMSTTIDPADRSTAVLFGDAGAACLIETVPADTGIVDHECQFLYDDWDALTIEAGGSAVPASCATVTRGAHFLRLRGPVVFRNAVQGMKTVAATVLARNDLRTTDIDWLVPHQANQRIIAAVAREIGIDCGRVLMNIERYGNTSAASIPLCLSEACRSGVLRRGDRILLVGFGGGLSAGAVYLRWAFDWAPATGSSEVTLSSTATSDGLSL